MRRWACSPRPAVAHAPEGVPVRNEVPPGGSRRSLDGVGWSQLTMSAANKMETEYMMWRKGPSSPTRRGTPAAATTRTSRSPRARRPRVTYPRARDGCRPRRTKAMRIVRGGSPAPGARRAGGSRRSARSRAGAQGEAHAGSARVRGASSSSRRRSATSSSTGTAPLEKLWRAAQQDRHGCAMCHPFTSDTHPHEFPKFQEQVNKFSTLRT
jgi:hypothetical protein